MRKIQKLLVLFPTLIALFMLGGFFTNLALGAEERGEAAQQIISRVCNQCHAVEVNGLCLSGDCQGPRVHRARDRDWPTVLSWMREAFGCKMTDDELKVISRYLTSLSPLKRPYPYTWQRVGITPGGWNVVSLQVHDRAIFAGVEGNGRIYRSTDGLHWKEVASTHEYTVYGITPFHGDLYAGTNDPKPQIWTSPDGLNWTLAADLPAEDHGVISLGVFKDYLYAGTAKASIYRSPDGRHWEKAAVLEKVPTANFTRWVRFLVEFQGKLYTGIEGGKLYRTQEGTQWTEVAQEVTQSTGIRGAAVFGDGLYVGTTRNGQVWRSKDGQTWTKVFDATTRRPGKYVASMDVYQHALYAGISGFIFRTKDGVEWEEVGNLSAFTIESMTSFGDSLYAGTTMPPNGWIYRTEAGK
jgi:hypothetical protein